MGPPPKISAYRIPLFLSALVLATGATMACYCPGFFIVSGLLAVFTFWKSPKPARILATGLIILSVYLGLDHYLKLRAYNQRALDRRLKHTNTVGTSALGAVLSETRATLEASSEWRTPIAFYGKVIDQNDRPVPGAVVEFRCNDSSLSGTSYYDRVSDKNGLFSLRGVSGKVLSVRAKKVGFLPNNPNFTDFFYAGNRTNHVGRKDTPVVFELFERGKTQELYETPIKVAGHIRIRPGAGETNISLFPNQSGKELIVSVSASREPGSNSRFSWNFIIKGISGAEICPVTSKNRYHAPETGYVESIEIKIDPKDPTPWRGNLTQELFVRGQGAHARLSLSYIVDNGSGIASINWTGK